MSSQHTLTMRSMKATPADLDRFAECFAANGKPRVRQVLEWQYTENPSDELYVDFALSDGTTAAVYATLAVRMKLGDDVGIGVQSIDTLTDQRFRGQGLFLRMAEHTYARCVEAGVPLVYGFPNENSAHGFFNRLGWTSLNPMPLHFRPIRGSYFLGRLGVPDSVVSKLPDLAFVSRRPRLLPTQEIRVMTRFDDRFTAVWDEFARNIRYAVHRDAQYLTWRFSKPKERYKTIGFFDDGKLLGYCIFALKTKHGGKVAYLMELLHPPDRADIGRSLAREALHDVAARGADVMLAFNFPHSPNHAVLREVRFLELPRVLQNPKLNIGVRALGAGEGAALGNRRNWYISYADSDTV